MKNAHDLVAAARQSIEEIAPAEAERVVRDADLIVDVREADEFYQGHVPGAVNIPRGLLEFKFSATPEFDARDLNILLYCKTSGRAALAAKSLADMGYLRVRSIAGGYDAWVEAGKPIAHPASIDYD